MYYFNRLLKESIFITYTYHLLFLIFVIFCCPISYCDVERRVSSHIRANIMENFDEEVHDRFSRLAQPHSRAAQSCARGG